MVFLGTCLSLSSRPNDLGTAALFAAFVGLVCQRSGKRGQLIGTEGDVRRLRRWFGMGIAFMVACSNSNVFR